MKKALIFLAAVSMLTLAGCSKKKDCNCKVTTPSPAGDISVETTVTIDDGDCGDLNTVMEVPNGMGGTQITVTLCE